MHFIKLKTPPPVGSLCILKLDLGNGLRNYKNILIVDIEKHNRFFYTKTIYIVRFTDNDSMHPFTATFDELYTCKK